ncbi:MAG: hypothetical protein ACXADY_20775 [Candidatus Hodarchaeales archaeon]|jgi:hypothetical protein
MALLTRDTTIEDYIAFITAKCQESNIDIESETCAFKEAIEHLSQYNTLRELTSDYPGRWAVITLRGWGESMDQELRSVCISRIKDPMDALHIYLDCDFLTNEDDAQLKAIFQGKLPQAEKELEDGIVTRKKVVS